MDQMIYSMREISEFIIGQNNINIMCYAYDVVLIVNNEDHLQHLLHEAVTRTNDFNMIVSNGKPNV